MRTLIIDANNLAWQAYHALPELSTDRRRTEIAFGFILRILRFAEEFSSNKFIFCFDSHRKYSKRRKIYPGYKDREQDPAKIVERGVVGRQIDILRKDLLPSLGFQNIFHLKGYEADDLIAYLVVPMKGEGRIIKEAIIVSSDDDLDQLIQYDVSIYKPRKRKLVKIQDYWKKQEKLGLRLMGPQFFAAEVKAIAGCKSDTIEGISGVGEMRAWAYLQETLKDGEFKKRIESKEGQKIIKRNRKLVHLPFGYRFDKGAARYKDVRIKKEILFRQDFIRTFDLYWFRYLLESERMEKWSKAMRLR